MRAQKQEKMHYNGALLTIFTELQGQELYYIHRNPTK